MQPFKTLSARPILTRPFLPLFKRPLIPIKREKRFNRERLPDPAAYYAKELGPLRNRQQYAQARCCFHDDHHPSLSINLHTGAFKCFACGAHGGDVVAFQMKRYHQDFKSAAQSLGAWI